MTTKKTTSKTSKTNKTATAGKSKKAPAKTSKAPAPKAKVPAKATAKATAKARDPKHLAVGAVLTRMFKGEQIEVFVTTAGLVYEGKTFSSLSAVARHITGYMISGPVFFKLVEPKRPAAEGK
ncbi:MAG: DUF2924 domain-containing protein [Ahniella sp.]|nr:DUF2924 domain-containing protein [Ahniella sp.]